MKLKKIYILASILTLTTFTGTLGSYSYFRSKSESTENIITIASISKPLCSAYCSLGPKYVENSNPNYSLWMSNTKKYICDELIKSLGDSSINIEYLEESTKGNSENDIFNPLDSTIDFASISNSKDKVIHNVVMFGSKKILGNNQDLSIKLSDDSNIKINIAYFIKNQQDIIKKSTAKEIGHDDIAKNLSRVRTFKFENNILKEYRPEINSSYDLIIYDFNLEDLINIKEQEVLIKHELTAEFINDQEKAKSNTIVIEYKNN
jgi:hypothetical protein